MVCKVIVVFIHIHIMVYKVIIHIMVYKVIFLKMKKLNIGINLCLKITYMTSELQGH